MTLLINDIVVADANPEYSLHIAVADTKNINLPFSIDVQESVVVVTEPKQEVDKAGKTPIPVVEPENFKSDNETVATLGPKDVVVKQESISVFIIIGIIALCIIICILYYASKCCDNKREEEDDIEKNANIMEGPETKPLIRNEEITNTTMDNRQLKESVESNLETEKKELSVEESEALEETLNNLREVTNSPSPMTKEVPKTKEISEDQVDSVPVEEKPSTPKLKRVPTLPRDHPSHEEDKASIAKSAQILRGLTDSLKRKEEEERGNKKSGIDNENNGIPMTEKHLPKKTLSRTSSIEIMRSKTVLLQNGEAEEKMLESTTMNIVTESNKAKFEAIELKIQVDPLSTHPGGISYTRMPEEDQTGTSYSVSSSVESLGGETQQPFLSESETDAPNIVLADVPAKARKTKAPIERAPVIQKPPVVPRTSNPTSPLKTSSPEINGSNLSR